MAMNVKMTMTSGAIGSLYASGYQAPEGSSAATYSPALNGDLMRSFACCLAAGTMGLLTPQAVESQYAKATSVAPVHYNIKGNQGDAAYDVELERSPAEDLARIREVLKPTMLELASLFGVSRQAAYDWQQGSQPIPQTAQRLAQLARVADVFAEAGLSVGAKTLRRKVAGGGTLLDAVSNGGNAESVARSLVGTLKREASQRERLQVQLAGRKRTPANYGDYGAPFLSEDV
jgi:transcriptional regulator with XRE-family HTH domain